MSASRWAIAVALALAACDGGGSVADPSSPSPTGAAAEVAEPCPEGAGEDHELGNPDRGGRYATFEVTRQSDLWVIARSFEHVGADCAAPGIYWLWTTTGNDVVLRSCVETVVRSVEPVR